MIDLQAVVERVLAAFEEEVGEEAPEHEIRRIAGTLAGVSYDEWFAAIAERDRMVLLTAALRLACEDMVEGTSESAERLLAAYVTGGGAQLSEDGVPKGRVADAKETVLGILIPDDEEDEGGTVRYIRDTPGLKEAYELAISNNAWNIERYKERIASLMLALETNERVLSSLPKLAQGEPSRKALAQTQAVIDLPEIEPRKNPEQQ